MGYLRRHLIQTSIDGPKLGRSLSKRGLAVGCYLKISCRQVGRLQPGTFLSLQNVSCRILSGLKFAAQIGLAVTFDLMAAHPWQSLRGPTGSARCSVRGGAWKERSWSKIWQKEGKSQGKMGKRKRKQELWLSFCKIKKVMEALGRPGCSPILGVEERWGKTRGQGLKGTTGTAD